MQQELFEKLKPLGNQSLTKMRLPISLKYLKSTEKFKPYKDIIEVLEKLEFKDHYMVWYRKNEPIKSPKICGSERYGFGLHFNLINGKQIFVDRTINNNQIKIKYDTLLLYSFKDEEMIKELFKQIDNSFIDCPQCKSGIKKQYIHVERGVCFKCSGLGRIHPFYLK